MCVCFSWTGSYTLNYILRLSKRGTYYAITILLIFLSSLFTKKIIYWAMCHLLFILSAFSCIFIDIFTSFCFVQQKKAEILGLKHKKYLHFIFWSCCFILIICYTSPCQRKLIWLLLSGCFVRFNYR